MTMKIINPFIIGRYEMENYYMFLKKREK